MQICKVEIKIGGDMLNAVVKDGVSVPEIVLLRAIHGAVDSVIVLDVTDETEVSNRAELERLHQVYSTATNSKAELWVDIVFPGMGVVLPQTLSDIGDSFAPAEPAPKASRKKKQTEVDPTESPE
jgi:hypothetical protein